MDSVSWYLMRLLFGFVAFDVAVAVAIGSVASFDTTAAATAAVVLLFRGVGFVAFDVAFVSSFRIDLGTIRQEKIEEKKQYKYKCLKKNGEGLSRPMARMWP